MVRSIGFSPDGVHLATAGLDGTVKVWDVEASIAAASGRESSILSASMGGILDLAYSPDGTRLATSSTNGTILTYVLDLEELKALARERLTRSLTDEECRQYLRVDECPAGS
jgi:WD40 repeat protein